MKKVTLLAAVAFLATTFTSCKKDYTCACTGSGATSGWNYEWKMTDVKKKDASDACDLLNTTYSGCS